MKPHTRTKSFLSQTRIIGQLQIFITQQRYYTEFIKGNPFPPYLINSGKNKYGKS